MVKDVVKRKESWSRDNKNKIDERRSQEQWRYLNGELDTVESRYSGPRRVLGELEKTKV